MGGDLDTHLEDRSIEELKNFHVSNNEDAEEIIDVMGEDEEFESCSTDDDVSDLTVFLGFLEKPKNNWSLLRQLFPSKAGGIPAWLDPINLPSGRSSVCGFCGIPLQFMLQVYCPIPDHESAFHRTLYMFICPSMACLLRDQHEQWKRQQPGLALRSVKVFRSQLPIYNEFYSDDPPKYDGSDRPSNVGAKLCTWCGTWRGNKVCGNCKEVHYCSVTHQSLHWNASHKTQCRQIIGSSVPGQGGCCQTLWPEYEIIEEEESHQQMETSRNKGSDGVDSASAGHGCVNPTSDILHVGNTNSNGDDDDDKVTWASFQTRLSVAPHQVLRYCRDDRGRPLWPTRTGKPSEDDIPKCGRCGGPRVFEFQVLPQLLYYFGVKNEKRSLDWSNICVYTCLNSCHTHTGYREEFTWVQICSSSF